MRQSLTLLLLPALAAGGLVSSAMGALKAQGDTPVVTIACCGAGRSAPPVVSEALGAKSDVSVVEAPTPLAVLDVAGASDTDGTSALAAADVLALEVRFLDLVEQSAHGLGQLQPMLQRSVRLRDLRPSPKLLLLTITDFDGSAASKADVTAFVKAQLDELVASLALPADASLSSADLLQLQCFFLPSKTSAPDGYEQGLESLRNALTSSSDSGYLIKGSLSAPASSVVSCIGAAAERSPSAAGTASPAEVHAAYQCGLLAETAAREFQKGASALRKAADASLLSDFGEQASSLVDEAVERFDADSAAFKGSAPVAAARAALAEQLQRALYGPFRKQLASLQRLTLSKLRAKVTAAKPAADIEVTMKSLLDEATASFDAQAKLLLPAGVRWTYTYERASLVETMEETATAHVQQLQVQGLYISKKGSRIPVDFSAHWLLPHPFGRDSRYDPITSSDEPAYKPQAAPMKLRATEGYKPRSKLTDPDVHEFDPKAMVFTDKMMQ